MAYNASRINYLKNGPLSKRNLYPQQLVSLLWRSIWILRIQTYVPIPRNPLETSVDTKAVFYFPGCSSERLFSQVGLATQAMLWHVGIQTVLPLGYLCCGYPQKGNSDFDKAEKMITDNWVLFHPVANTLNYLDINTVVVSCGTCYDQLVGYQFDQIFPRLSNYWYSWVPARERSKTRGLREFAIVLCPCYAPMKLHDPLKTVDDLIALEGWHNNF